jgi:nucleoporin POM152
VVGPKSSENIVIPNIESSRKTLDIRIPEKIDREGGAFEIDLGKSQLHRTTSLLAHRLFSVSVEDKYKCKRSLSVPGMRVNVRRVKV